MTKSQSTILHCLRANVTNATSCGLAEFAKEQLRKFERRLERQKPVTRPAPSWDKICTDEKP